MFEDTIHTKRLSDKLKIWYGPTNWRPDDVIERNPSSGNLVFDDKFNPQLSVHQRVYAVAQLIFRCDFCRDTSQYYFAANLSRDCDIWCNSYLGRPSNILDS